MDIHLLSYHCEASTMLGSVKFLDATKYDIVVGNYL